MKTYPLASITLEQAEEKQFRMVEEIMRHFTGEESLSLGDLGCVQGTNKPRYAQKAEEVIASFFHAQACQLVTGAGTGAIRWGLTAMMEPGSALLVHAAPIYSTSEVSIRGLGLKVVRADFNDPEEIRKAMRENRVDGALIQHSRQVPEDSYHLEDVIRTIKEEKDIPVLIDDNYAVMKVDRIGVECGADLSAFSSFKLLGPEGVGILTGKKEYIDRVHAMNYSGGSKVQGWQAMEVLRGLVYAPVSLAIQAQQGEKLVRMIEQDHHPLIQDAYLANSQSKVLLVELTKDIAPQVLAIANRKGALPYPVGAESKYECAPLFYRASGTYLKKDPSLEKRMLRINPNRASAETVYRVLRECLQEAENVSEEDH